MNLTVNRLSFKGTTAIRCVTDSHQEARRECAFLTRIKEQAQKNNNILLLNCGDLFCGVYSRDMMLESYLAFKKSTPNVEVVMTIGNNDPLSKKDKYSEGIFPFSDANSTEFLKKTLEEFQKAGIHVVCANIKDSKTGDYPAGVKPYEIIERDGDRILVTGFCINKLPKNLGFTVSSQKEAFDELKSAIDAEAPDAIIVLNHDYLNTSVNLFEYAKSKGIEIDLTVGGHDHNDIPSDTEKRIYNPKSFSRSMFEMDLQIKENIKRILNVREVLSDSLPVDIFFEKILEEYEEESGLLKPVAKRVLDLPKSYANPGALGTFIADGMKKESGAELAFFASNVTKIPLPYFENGLITNYDLRKTIPFDSTIQTAHLSADEILEALNSSVKNRLKLRQQNGNFLQCSGNVKIKGIGNIKDNSYTIKQIYIDGKPLFDENGNAIEPEKKYLCAFDNFIPTDGRSKALQNAVKSDVKDENGKNLRLDDVLKKSLIEAQGKYKEGEKYPVFRIKDEIINA